MSNTADIGAARHEATLRRAAGVTSDFDPARLALARRLAGLQRTRIARAAGITPAAITQFEKGQTRPTIPVLQALSATLGVPPEFFRTGYPVHALPAGGAHFRSLRATSSLEREKALAFAELVLALVEAIERYVELPEVRLPALDISPTLEVEEIRGLAQQARAQMGVGPGPVPHVVRLLETHGVVVVRLDDATKRVDAFSHQSGPRPVILLSPMKADKARSRFDAAHELGHLLIHPDTEPGSRLVEEQAHAFAAEFLMPAAQIARELPTRLDWSVLHDLKRRWGVSLRALVVRGHKLGRFGDSTYQRAMRQLSSWGLPEPGPLGPPEVPVLIPRAVEILEAPDPVSWLAQETGMPAEIIVRVLDASGSRQERPPVLLGEFRRTGQA